MNKKFTFYFLYISTLLFISPKLYSAQAGKENFETLLGAQTYWLSSKDLNDTVRYYNNYLKDYCQLTEYAVHHLLNDNTGLWQIEVIASYNYYGNRIPISYSEILINNFNKRERVPINTFYFIYRKDKPSIRLIVNIEGTTINIYSRQEQIDELKLLDREFEKYKIEKNFYKFGILELFTEDNCIHFFSNINDFNYIWDDLILGNDFKQMCYDNTSQFIKSISPLRSAGLHPKKGILLYGPPGTGKSFLGQILISNTLNGALKGINTFFVSTARHLQKASSISHLLKTAKELSPTTLFMEDVDLIGFENRNPDSNLNHLNKEFDWDAQDRLNELLNGLDGLSDSEGVLTIFTTNKQQNLDSALLRSGRVGLKFYFDLPKFFERKVFFERFGKSKAIWEEGLTSEWLSSETDFFSGADIIEAIGLTKQYAYIESSMTPDNLLFLKKSHFKNAIDLIRSQLNSGESLMSGLNQKRNSYLKSFRKHNQ